MIVVLLVLPMTISAQEMKVKTNGATAEFYFVEKDTRGTLYNIEAFINIDQNDLSKSTIGGSVDVSTLNTKNSGRDEHLMSEDFFDAKKYPKMRFESSRIEQVGDKYKAYGNLTIRDITKEVVFDLSYSDDGFLFATNINTMDYGMQIKEEPELNLVEVTILVPLQ